MTEHLLKIGEVATQAGVSTRTVDYYTTLGLITPTARTGGSFRLYAQDVVDRITTIRQLEALGVGLDDITKTLAAAPGADVATLLTRLDQDLHALQTTADTGMSVDAARLLMAAVTRAHHLITAALDITANLPPGP